MKSPINIVVAAVLAFSAIAPTSAGAVTISKPVSVGSQTNGATEVAWRGRGFGRHYGGYGYRRHRGIGPGAVIGGIVAGALIAGAIRESRASGSDIDRCEAAYQSFDPRSGTYLGYDGARHVCPYLE